MLLICFHESFLFGVAVADPTLENKPDLDPAQIRNSDMQDPDPAFFFSGYQDANKILVFFPKLFCFLLSEQRYIYVSLKKTSYYEVTKL